MSLAAAILRRNHFRRRISEKLTDEQVKEYQDAFQMFDKDCNGYITTRELKSLMRCLGCNPTDSELQQIVNEVDADGNGKIDLPEFISLMEKMAKPTEEHASTIEAYRAFDGAGVGFIHSKIIREIIIKSLDQVPMNEIIDMLDYSDLLQDRNVYYEEFAKLVTPRGLFNVSAQKLHDFTHGHRTQQISFESDDN
ncbi:uncharacterized protein LOC130624056 isoform X2 [Hydractinia symbiolongicarpus]|uniref:uncharacterized protein LOC130624056 isoform X2 n=1 Tax=Hydractinia symbiolongicarpus TaxID=13093 RepID=UPI00254F96F3|nr:uncharacterized protein LOC130624056 isoform X2 [Hydractinia symbiolongicarpus]